MGLLPPVLLAILNSLYFSDGPPTTGSTAWLSSTLLYVPLMRVIFIYFSDGPATTGSTGYPQLSHLQSSLKGLVLYISH
jgi:hypothetical protein